MPLIYILLQQNDEFLENSLINDPEYADTIHHSYPLGTVCHVTGCYTDLLNHPQETLQNASCTVCKSPTPYIHTIVRREYSCKVCTSAKNI